MHIKMLARRKKPAKHADRTDSSDDVSVLLTFLV